MRCPQCESTWIGYPVPAGAVAVQDDRGQLTLAREGRFLNYEDHIDQSKARCLDCDTRFSGEQQ